MWVPINSENRSRGCSENSGFRITQVVRRHSENGISHSENYFLNSEPRAALRIPRNAPRAPRMAFSLRERFPEMGVLPRLLMSGSEKIPRNSCQAPARFPCIKSQEKGVLAKGVSVESSVTAKETKSTQGYWAQQYIGRHSQERHTFFQKPPSKKTFFLVPDCKISRIIR